ncbi:hypothetical protein BH11MYX1_BH11MYX1_52140 [soil metagenome]
MQVRLGLAVLLVTALAGRAVAYPSAFQFDQDPVTGDGAGGIPFDGAPRWVGHSCDVCHIGAPHLISIALEADHPELFTTGWAPGQQYHLRVVLLNEWAGLAYVSNGANCGQVGDTPFKPCDDNGFALELDDHTDKPTGTFAQVANDACTTTVPAEPIVGISKNGAAIHEQHNGRTSWDVCWTAPAAGTGDITAYLAVVDGNGGTGSVSFPNDTLGDDVAAGAVPLTEAGSSSTANVGGCNATGDSAGLGLVLALALLAVRRRRTLVVGALVVATASGCVHVRPRQRETLAHRNMTFAPDGAEDELDLHMQESREGSSGGYGSSGGGCGCN